MRTSAARNGDVGKDHHKSFSKKYIRDEKPKQILPAGRAAYLFHTHAFATARSVQRHTQHMSILFTIARLIGNFSKTFMTA